jgi:hypothetical protein
VGAAMAAGSQAEKGIWALLVILPIRREKRIIFLSFSSISQFPLKYNIPIKIIITESPNRLEKIDRIPDFKVLLLKKKIINKNDETPKPSHPTIIEIVFGERISRIIEVMNRVVKKKNFFFVFSLFIYIVLKFKTENEIKTTVSLNNIDRLSNIIVITIDFLSFKFLSKNIDRGF